jgi:hypothetical protein
MNFSDCVTEMFKELVDSGMEGMEVACSDGFTRTVVPIVAAWLGDREEHEIIATLVKVK